jgi:hypothetical protein
MYGNLDLRKKPTSNEHYLSQYVFLVDTSLENESVAIVTSG